MKNVISAQCKGSALLLVIMIMGALLMYLTTIWMAASYTHENALAHTTYQERYWLQYALMMWTVELCKKNFDTMQAHVHYGPKSISIKKWPPSSKQSCSAVVGISTINETKLALKVTLDSKKMHCYCLLKRIKEDGQPAKFVLEEWDDNHL